MSNRSQHRSSLNQVVDLLVTLGFENVSPKEILDMFKFIEDLKKQRVLDCGKDCKDEKKKRYDDRDNNDNMGSQNGPSGNLSAMQQNEIVV